MNQSPISRTETHSPAKVLLLTNDLTSPHGVREGIRRAGSSAILETAAAREEFLSRLHSDQIDLILAAATGLPELPIAEILELSRNTAAKHIPVVLIGTDGEEWEAVQALRNGVSDYVRVTQLGRLPAIIERALREQRDRDRQVVGQVELDHAAEILRESQKLLTLGRLAASIAHEINNPLESITNLLYLLEIDHESPEKSAEYLKMAQRELNRVVQISKQTLTFSRETSSPEHLYLAELVEEVLVLHRRKIAAKNLRVIRQYETSEAITGFSGEMRQVLSNLIANAIEATGENGKVVLRIRFARKWSDPGVLGLRFSVADNGSGISPEARKRLGEPFFTTKGHSGTGLGLWVTQSILSRYGGSLRMRSSVSRLRHGTVFSIFFPTNMRPLAVTPGENGSNGVTQEKAALDSGSRSSGKGLNSESRLRVSGI
jgi:two-component system, NtrC family, sensor kinase